MEIDAYSHQIWSVGVLEIFKMRKSVAYTQIKQLYNSLKQKIVMATFLKAKIVRSEYGYTDTY